jgi:hypothetical protein
VSGARQRFGGVEKYSSIASQQASEHGSKARLFGAGLEDLRQDLRRDVLGAVDADPGAEQPAARAVATRLVRCQSEALAHQRPADKKDVSARDIFFVGVLSNPPQL